MIAILPQTARLLVEPVVHQPTESKQTCAVKRKKNESVNMEDTNAILEVGDEGLKGRHS